jgi:GNAT superfamily N-acetyltransferase
MSGAGKVFIREARETEEGIVLEFIRALAGFEGLSSHVEATEEDIRKALFENRSIGAAIAWSEPENESEGQGSGQPVGLIVYYRNFSTFRGKTGLYIEDIFVDERWRGQGIARKLIAHLGETARAESAFCLQWAVLDWNERAKALYRSIGGKPLAGWELWRKDLEE